MREKKTRKRQYKGGSPFSLNRIEKRRQTTMKRNMFMSKYRNVVPEIMANQTKQYIPLELQNNGDYTQYKYTWLQPGQRFQFRSKKELKASDIEPRPMWLNYSASKGKPSFLLVNETGQLNERVPKGMAKVFGPWLNTIEVKNYILILHFPVIYDDTTDLPDSFPAYYEGAVRQICIMWKIPVCASGYTLDFLYSPHTSKHVGWNGLPLIPHYRELCILEPIIGENIEFISSIYTPIL
jgi:hypothetical protein